MSNYPQFNYPAFHENAKFLRAKGWDIISPAELDAEIGIDANTVMTEERYLEVIKHDYAALLECDSIIFMPGWEKSRGAKLESDFANVLKLDRYRVDADNSYFEKELILAFCGFATVGKDTIAQEFVQNDGFERHGFADALKEILYELNPLIFHKGLYYRTQDLVDRLGWEEAKKITEVRQLLQRLGTEAGRKALGEDVWVNTLFSQPHKARLVIPDLRFENEANEVRRRGGIVIRVMRDGVGPVNDHSSDQISFDADITVYNNGTPKKAYMNIVEVLPEFGIEL